MVISLLFFVSDVICFAVAVPQGLRDSAELAGLAKSMNIKDTAINGNAHRLICFVSWFSFVS